MDVEIIKRDGNSFLLSSHDIYAKDFIVSSVELEPHYNEVENRSGRIDNGATYKARTITVPFYIKAHDLHDYALLRDELFSLVVSRESFYIRELRRAEYQAYNFTEVTEKASDNPQTDNKFVGGKRYKVRLTNVIELEQMLTVGEGELIFETTELPFAESIGTTADITGNVLKYSDELWSYGMGLSYGDTDEYKYIHGLKEFSIFNAGSVTVHPFEMDLKIKVGPIYNSDEFLEIKNKTTGDILRFNEGMSGKEILIDGPNITVDGLQALRKTNRKFISLAPGWNHFEIDGTSSSRIEFDFRFYYK